MNVTIIGATGEVGQSVINALAASPTKFVSSSTQAIYPQLTSW